MKHDNGATGWVVKMRRRVRLMELRFLVDEEGVFEGIWEIS